MTIALYADAECAQPLRRIEVVSGILTDGSELSISSNDPTPFWAKDDAPGSRTRLAVMVHAVTSLVTLAPDPSLKLSADGVAWAAGTMSIGVIGSDVAGPFYALNTGRGALAYLYADTGGADIPAGTFEDGTTGDAIESRATWSLDTTAGTPALHELDDEHALGNLSLLIKGSASANTQCGAKTSVVAGASVNGSQVTFATYSDSTNQTRLYLDYSQNSYYVEVAGQAVKILTNKAGDPDGYTTDALTQLGSGATWAATVIPKDQWVLWRITGYWTGTQAQTYTLEVSLDGGATWTFLHRSGATDDYIPMKYSGTATAFGSLAIECLQNVQVWVDEITTASDPFRSDTVTLIGSETFESGTDGSALAGTWSLDGTPANHEYDDAHARTGSLSAWIRGSATPGTAYGAKTSATVGATNQSRILFSTYIDAPGSRVIYDYTGGSFYFTIDASGHIHVRTDKAGNPNGYTTSANVLLGSGSAWSAFVHPTGWVDWRISPNFTTQRYIIEACLDGVTWTALARNGASDNGIPMKYSGTVTSSGSTSFECYQDVNLWVDDIALVDVRSALNIALIGDSTFQTSYLKPSSNNSLVAHQPPCYPDLGTWAADSDGRLSARLQRSLTLRGKTVTVSNYGIGGWRADKCLTDTTAYSGQTQLAHVIATAPGIAVVNFGFNDGWHGVTIPDYTAALESIIDQLVAADITPVLSNCSWQQYGPTYGSLATGNNALWAPYNEAMQSIAADYGLTFVDVNERFHTGIDAGTWDVMGHDSASYVDPNNASYAGWFPTPAPTEFTEAYYQQAHQWTTGTDWMADEMAARLCAYEPTLGGTASSERSDEGIVPVTAFAFSLVKTATRSSGSLDFIFGGVSAFSLGLRVKSVPPRGGVGAKPQTVTIPGRPGAWLSSVDEDVRTIPVQVMLRAPSVAELPAMLREVEAWLRSDSPQSLVFEDEPDLQYFAVLSGDLSLVRTRNVATGVVTFLCSDPYAYAVSEEPTALSPGDFWLTNDGTAPTRPRFVFPIIDDETYLRLEHPDGRFIQLGQVPLGGRSNQPAQTIVLTDDCSSTSGWSAGQKHMQYGSATGAVAGTMASDGYNFVATDLSTGAAWHGPTLRQGVTAAQDFDVFVRVIHDNTASPLVRVTNEAHTLTGTGTATLAHPSLNGAKVAIKGVSVTASGHTTKYKLSRDITVGLAGGATTVKRRGTKIPSGASVKFTYDYLVGKCGGVMAAMCDADGSELIRVQAFDSSPTAKAMRVYATVGSTQEHVLVDGAGYDNLNGYFRLQRVGDLFTASVWQLDGNGNAYALGAWAQTLPGHTDEAAMIDLNESAYGAYSTTNMAIADVSVAQINDVSAIQIPVILTAGDSVEVNCAEYAIRKNGLPYMQPMTFGSEFFDLEPGDTELTLRMSNPGSVDFDGDSDEFDPTTDATAFVMPRWY